ncbi:MAG: hypothetical protein FJ382_00285 [Verrucomicrobia bacterium]|nr:hypothetical protein [Verrucomicrobiota bacterium]
MAVLLVGLGLGSRALALGPPLHPTLLSAEHQNAMHPVVDAAKDRAVVSIAGGLKTLPALAPLQVARAARYHPVRAQLDPQVIERTRYGLADLSMQQIQAQDIKVSVEVTAEADVPDAYLLVICEDLLASATGKPGMPTLRLQKIGALRAEETEYVEFTVRTTRPQRFSGRAPAPGGDGSDQRLYWQLFSEGIELKTNLSGEVAPFHRRREEQALALAVAAWLRENAGGDRAAQPFLQIPPLLEEKEGLPASVLATLTVAPNGMVSGVSLDPSPAAETRAALESALGGWLFLPAVKSGRAVETRIRVPLKF